MIYRTSSFIEHYLLESEKWQTSKDKSFNEAILRESCGISETTAAAGTTSPAADTHSGFLPFGRRWWPWVWAGRATEGRTRTRSSGCCDRLACAPEGSVKTCECYQTSCCWEEKTCMCAAIFDSTNQTPQERLSLWSKCLRWAWFTAHFRLFNCALVCEAFYPPFSPARFTIYFSLYLLKTRKMKRKKTSMSQRL